MTMPLDTYGVIEKYREKYKDNEYFDIDLVMKAYSRMFAKTKDACLGVMAPSKEDNNKKEYKKTDFADRIDKEIEKMKKKGIKRYVYCCDLCGRVQTFIFTSEEEIPEIHVRRCGKGMPCGDRTEYCIGRLIREDIYIMKMKIQKGDK